MCLAFGQLEFPLDSNFLEQVLDGFIVFFFGFHCNHPEADASYQHCHLFYISPLEALWVCFNLLLACVPQYLIVAP